MRYIITNGVRSYVIQGETANQAEMNYRKEMGIPYIFARGETVTTMSICELHLVAHKDGQVHEGI